MTESPIVREKPAALSRRVGWFALACVVTGLALTIAGRLAGATIRWTAWALPILIAANVAVMFFGWLARWPRLVRVYLLFSVGLAAAITVSEVVALSHR